MTPAPDNRMCKFGWFNQYGSQREAWRQINTEQLQVYIYADFEWCEEYVGEEEEQKRKPRWNSSIDSWKWISYEF